MGKMGDLFDIFCLFVVFALKVLFFVFALCCVNAACTLWQRSGLERVRKLQRKEGRGK